MHIIERIKQLITHRFARDAAVLQAGTVAGTLIQAVAGVVVARLLAPELFGQYALVFSVASITTILLGAGVQDAVIPQVSRAWATGDQSAVRQALGFFAKFTGANIIATVAVVLVLPAITARLYHAGSIGWYAAIVVIASLVSTTVFTLTQLALQVTGRIRALAAITLADVSTRYVAVVGLLLAGFGIVGAVSGHLVGAALLSVASILVYRRLLRNVGQLLGLGELLLLARRTAWRPLLAPTIWIMMDRNLGMLYAALPVAMVGFFASGAEVGYFKLAFGYLMLAMSALGPVSTLLNTHFPVVQVTGPKHLRSTFIRVTMYSTLFSIVITVVVVVISPWVFRALYGAAYLPSILYVYGFSLFGALFGLGVGLGPMWRAVDKVYISIVINLLVLGAGVPLGILLITRWHIWGAVAMVTLWYTVSHLVSFLYLLKALKSHA